MGKRKEASSTVKVAKSPKKSKTEEGGKQSSEDGNKLDRKKENVVSLDGENLTIEDLMSLDSAEVTVQVTESAWKRVRDSRKVVEDILKKGKIVYGINTGFGSFADVPITKDKLAILQENLIRSHAAGVGNPLNLQRARRLLALRINILAKGRSGIREETLKILVQACNAWCLPWVPEKGTLGASGDLAPLSHLALGLMGEGKMWDPKKQCWGEAGPILKKCGITPIKLEAKEGLALINGTQMIVSLGAEALKRAENATIVADIAGAMTLEALKGTTTAFDPAIHQSRPHEGQIQIASRLTSILKPKGERSEITKSHEGCKKVQDSYTLRCMPQVHGIVTDTLKFVRGVLTTEMNSATDNPMVFEDGRILSGGNFHGEYPAKVLDYLAIAVHELANISERRTERLVNTSLSELPAFLVKDGGLNSGFMIAHCTSAALVSENKVLCHPSSIDSISTSASKEDHVSMGGWSARKALEVVQNVETVLSIELLAACQGIDCIRPLKTSPPLEAVHAKVRTEVSPWDEDRFMQPDIDAVLKFVQNGEIIDLVAPYLE